MSAVLSVLEKLIKVDNYLSAYGARNINIRENPGPGELDATLRHGAARYLATKDKMYIGPAMHLTHDDMLRFLGHKNQDVVHAGHIVHHEGVHYYTKGPYEVTEDHNWNRMTKGKQMQHTPQNSWNSLMFNISSKGEN